MFFGRHFEMSKTSKSITSYLECLGYELDKKKVLKKAIYVIIALVFSSGWKVKNLISTY